LAYIKVLIAFMVVAWEEAFSSSFKIVEGFID
jgi:hypothetical protein